MRAKDVMSEWVISVPVGASVFDAAELLVDAEVSAAPVVDRNGNLVGIVSESDLMRRAETETAEHKGWLLRLLASDAQSARDFVRSHSRHVSDVMTRKVVTATEDATLGELADLMEKHAIKRVPVVREGRVVGIVSRSDLLQALLAREPGLPPMPRPDKEIREAVDAGLAEQPWVSSWPTNVVVERGVVHLWGFVPDETVRRAYRVVAENVPGVRRVKNHLRPIPSGVNMGV